MSTLQPEKWFKSFSGTSRIERNCTATIKTETGSDKTVTVYVCHSHYGHKAELQHLSITERQKKASKRYRDKLSLMKLRDYLGETYQRIHLMETNDDMHSRYGKHTGGVYCNEEKLDLPIEILNPQCLEF